MTYVFALLYMILYVHSLHVGLNAVCYHKSLSLKLIIIKSITFLRYNNKITPSILLVHAYIQTYLLVLQFMYKLNRTEKSQCQNTYFNRIDSF